MLKNVVVSIWDFGGQEYYHDAYRLFMSANSVYLLLWCKDKETDQNEKDRKDIESFEERYWLDTIRYYGGDGGQYTILAVQNKVDDISAEKQRINQELHVEYAINESYHISLKEGSNPDKPRQQRLLLNFISELEHILHEESAKSQKRPGWNQIRSEIIKLHKEDKPSNYFEPYLKKNGSVLLPDFHKICEEIVAHSIENEELHLLLRWLNRGGSISFFPNLLDLEDLVFLKPNKLVESIYEILDRNVLAAGGEFNPDTIKQFRKKTKSLAVFLGVAQKLELIFPHPDPIKKLGYYIAPQYLPESHPIEDLFKTMVEKPWESGFWLKMPAFFYKKILYGLLRIFAFDKETEARYFWKHGLVFLRKELKVFIKGIRSEKKQQESKLYLYIEKGKDEMERERLYKEIFKVCFMLLTHGENEQELMKIIREGSVQASQKGRTAGVTLSKVMDTFDVKIDKDSSIAKRIEASYNGLHFVKYADLVEYASKQEVKIPASDGKSLLLLRHFAPLLPFAVPPAKRIFFSYAHADAQFRNELEVHFAALKNGRLVETWHDMEILPGENWNTRIMEEIENADIVLGLISPDFMNSRYIWEKEFPQMKGTGKKNKFIPIFLRPCDIEGTFIEATQGAPFDNRERDNAKEGGIQWIVSSRWAYRDEAYLAVINKLKAVLKD